MSVGALPSSLQLRLRPIFTHTLLEEYNFFSKKWYLYTQLSGINLFLHSEVLFI